MTSAIPVPATLRRRLNASIQSLLNVPARGQIDFLAPAGAPALLASDSLSWRIFKNPVALFVGGTTAVLLELAEPAVRAGVWEHSTFRRDPLTRLQRTGLAAMVTIYGAREAAERMIAHVVRMHASVRGMTAGGLCYSANDPRLLSWVHATAAFSFASAYDRYVARLDQQDFGRFYRESTPVALLYGATSPPQSVADMAAIFEIMRPRLSPSPIVFDFLRIMQETPALPASLRWMQPALVRAAVDLLPQWVRGHLGISRSYDLSRRERWLIRMAGAGSDRIVLSGNPAVQACVRLGLPPTHLYA